MRVDYPTLETLHHQARRERAQAVYQLIVAPVVRFFARPAAQPKPTLRSRPA